MSWLEEHAKRHQELNDAATARGAKPISAVPGPGLRSFAEDDPEQHAGMATPQPPLTDETK